MNRKYLNLWIVLVLTMTFFVQCKSTNQNPTSASQKASETKTESFANINTQELNEKIKANPNLFVLDVRNPDEFAQGHIKGATLIPVDAIDQRSTDLEAKKDSEIYVICAKGGRSSKASAVLASKGFKKIINVEGGMTSWQEKGFPVDK